MKNGKRALPEIPKGITIVRAKGRAYVYAWRGGPRLYSPVGSAKFFIEYEAALSSRLQNQLGQENEMTDYYSLDKNKLAQDTLKKASEVYEVTDAAWYAMPQAVLSCCVAVCSFVLFLFSQGDGERMAGSGILFLVSFFWWLRAHGKWQEAIHNCNTYADDMRKRRDALERKP